MEEEERVVCDVPMLDFYFNMDVKGRAVAGNWRRTLPFGVVSLWSRWTLAKNQEIAGPHGIPRPAAPGVFTSSTNWAI